MTCRVCGRDFLIQRIKRIPQRNLDGKRENVWHARLTCEECGAFFTGTGEAPEDAIDNAMDAFEKGAIRTAEMDRRVLEALAEERDALTFD